MFLGANSSYYTEKEYAEYLDEHLSERSTTSDLVFVSLAEIVFYWLQIDRQKHPLLTFLRFDLTLFTRHPVCCSHRGG